jgi:hypothetical protein
MRLKFFLLAIILINSVTSRRKNKPLGLPNTDRPTQETSSTKIHNVPATSKSSLGKTKNGSLSKQSKKGKRSIPPVIMFIGLCVVAAAVDNILGGGSSAILQTLARLVKFSSKALGTIPSLVSKLNPFSWFGRIISKGAGGGVTRSSSIAMNKNFRPKIHGLVYPSIKASLPKQSLIFEKMSKFPQITGPLLARIKPGSR